MHVSQHTHDWIYRHLAWVYGILYALGFGWFYHTKYYRLEASLDVYYRVRHNTAEWGLSRFHGNLLMLHSPLMIALLVLGVVAGIIIFVNSRFDALRAWPGLIIALGAAVPLMPPYTENLVARIYCSFGLVAFGIWGQLIVGRSLPKRSNVKKRWQRGFAR
ncbi:hypothetical protein [Lacticaseibacillus parakribbianus]|uniref:hypothetical protein n=1 Tax=Lacticaseibacillus parakribbianus TaxID=2970927 RepID=UPI0021CB0047|nr:hypothetical protein [Lacticaseibacillus parakribbianus]